eukprot:4613158-Prymnesium_polylepis.1
MCHRESASGRRIAAAAAATAAVASGECECECPAGGRVRVPPHQRRRQSIERVALCAALLGQVHQRVALRGRLAVVDGDCDRLVQLAPPATAAAMQHRAGFDAAAARGKSTGCSKQTSPPGAPRA